MTARDREQIAREVAKELATQMDRMLPLEKVVEVYGLSATFLRRKGKDLGGVKWHHKWYFSQANLENMIRNCIESY